MSPIGLTTMTSSLQTDKLSCLKEKSYTSILLCFPKADELMSVFDSLFNTINSSFVGI